jgi:DUF4097 and DUF4098 domain-containing protein YvlB
MPRYRGLGIFQKNKVLKQPFVVSTIYTENRLTMKKQYLTLIALLLCGALMAQDKKVSKSFSSIKTIQIKTASGNVRLKRSADQQVKVDLSYTYDEDEYTPQMDASGSKLTLTEDFSRGNHSGSATWDVQVPADLVINISSGSGEVNAEGISADLRTSVGSGDLSIRALKGSVNMNTGSGNIDATEIDGDLSLNTGSGDIRLEQGNGDVSVNAGSGTITMKQMSGAISANTGSGHIKATGITLKGRSKFNSGSGDALVTLSAPLDFDISVNSGSGDAVLNFNGNDISGKIVMTANKRSGNIVAPFKFDTEETIDDRGSDERIQKTAMIGSKNINIKIGTGSGTAEIKK